MAPSRNMAFAAAFSSLCGYGLAFWLPSVLMRSHGFDLIETSRFVAALLIVGGVSGVFLGGWLADRLGQADRGWYAKLPAIAWLISAPMFAAALYAPSPTVAWLLFLLPNGLNILWLGPVTTAGQHLVPAHMRATASASFLFINNLIGLGLGTWYFGAVSDALTPRFGDEALRYAIYSGLCFYLVSAALFTLTARGLKKDWVE